MRGRRVYRSPTAASHDLPQIGRRNPVGQVGDVKAEDAREKKQGQADEKHPRKLTHQVTWIHGKLRIRLSAASDRFASKLVSPRLNP